MKSLFLFSILGCFALDAVAQDKTKPVSMSARDTFVVDASCGQCKFGLTGNDCTLAVRIKGKAYFVDGTSIDDHGDAHAGNGFCNAVRKAEVKGEVVGDRFKVSYFKLLPEVIKKEKSD
jgi:hypothetical protein